MSTSGQTLWRYGDVDAITKFIEEQLAQLQRQFAGMPRLSYHELARVSALTMIESVIDPEDYLPATDDTEKVRQVSAVMQALAAVVGKLP